jgi:putative restriction endonuclease
VEDSPVATRSKQKNASTAWSMISLEDDERQYAGNLGYEDDLRRVYRFNSHVPNHTRVKRGDLVLLRNKTRLLGVARIDALDSREDTTVMLRCPECRSVAKPRRKMSPKYRCKLAHEFETPIRIEAPVRVFEARYASTYIEIDDSIPVSLLKAAAPRANDQMSIEEVDITKLERALIKSNPKCAELLAVFAQSDSVGEHEAEATDEPFPSMHVRPEDALEPGYLPTMLDTRRAVMRTILARRGQRKFRDALIRRYGARCVVTGCPVMHLLEAAHISPFRDDNDNHPENGLLLRADIHTLFDLHWLAIEPGSLRVHIAPILRALAPYAELNGAQLLLPDEARPADEALRLSMQAFLTEFRSDSDERARQSTSS